VGEREKEGEMGHHFTTKVGPFPLIQIKDRRTEQNKELKFYI
jgi:hypothetical protein